MNGEVLQHFTAEMERLNKWFYEVCIPGLASAFGHLAEQINTAIDIFFCP